MIRDGTKNREEFETELEQQRRISCGENLQMRTEQLEISPTGSMK